MKIAIYGMAPWQQKELQEMTFEEQPEYRFIDGILTPETVKLAEGCDAVSILTNSIVTEELAEALSKAGIRYLTNRAAGKDNLAPEILRKYHLDAANVPVYSPQTISEYTVLMVLSLLRKMRRNQNLVKRNDYTLDGIRGRLLGHMTAGIIGAGHIGSVTAKILSGFGCRVLVHDIVENDEIRGFAEYVTMDELLERSDVIMLHCPATPATHHIINRESIAKCKDGVYLVNTARGACVDTEAVRDALDSGKIAAFAFDVYEGEDAYIRLDLKGEYPDDPLFEDLCKRENVIYSAHTAFYTDEASLEMDRISTENLVDFVLHGKSKNSVLGQ